MDDKPIGRSPDGVVRGSCLCGAIAFHVTEPFKMAYNCHCSRCRLARSAAHASNGFTSSNGVHFLRGKDHLKSYKVPEARYFTQVFCDVCSSPMPRLTPNARLRLFHWVHWMTTRVSNQSITYLLPTRPAGMTSLMTCRLMKKVHRIKLSPPFPI